MQGTQCSQRNNIHLQRYAIILSIPETFLEISSTIPDISTLSFSLRQFLVLAHVGCQVHHYTQEQEEYQ